MCKEEIGLLVAMMGLWAAFVRRRWWLGLGTAVAGVAWFLVAVQVIMPHFSGLRGSAFLVRYGHLGDSLVDMGLNLVRRPGLVAGWMLRPDVHRYLRDLWLGSGGLAILHPLVLVMALPSVAINALSGFDWMRSGGGHYSAAIVPFLAIAAAYGIDLVARLLGKGRSAGVNWSRYGITAALLAGTGLAVALVHHHQNGITPLSRRFSLPPVSEHSRRSEPLLERLNSLPPEVPISVGSNLYPHVAHRKHVYLFPTVSDAEVIALDVNGPSSPVGIGEQSQIVRELLDYAEFGIRASDHGILVLERDLDEYRLSPGFFEAFHSENPEPDKMVEAQFGGSLLLRGFDWESRSVVRPELVVEITTYWEVLSPLEDEYQLVFYFLDENGDIADVRPEERAVQWYPTWQWEPGQVVSISLPPLPVGDLSRAGVAVVRTGSDPGDRGSRLAPITSPSGRDLPLWDEGSILELVGP
jgi:hypothetical protein